MGRREEGGRVSEQTQLVEERSWVYTSEHGGKDARVHRGGPGPGAGFWEALEGDKQTGMGLK